MEVLEAPEKRRAGRGLTVLTVIRCCWLDSVKVCVLQEP